MRGRTVHPGKSGADSVELAAVAILPSAGLYLSAAARRIG